MSIKTSVTKFIDGIKGFFGSGEGGFSPEEINSCTEVSNKWLDLIDENKYDESWDQGSKTLQMTFPRNEWRILLENTRKPFGEVTKRDILDVRTAKNPSGLPPGSYIVVFYNTKFPNRVSQELVTLVKESDGAWRILTYQIN